MMEHAACPIDGGDEDLPTLKARMVEILTYSPENLPFVNPDTLSLQAIKLEADARLGVLLPLMTHGILTREVEVYLAGQITERHPDDGKTSIFQTFTDVTADTLPGLYLHQFAKLTESKKLAFFIDHMEAYRQAYFARSPATNDPDKQYVSTAALLQSGGHTFATHCGRLLYSLDGQAQHVEKLSEAETAALALESAHLATALGKLELAKLTEYIAFVNQHEGIQLITVQIVRPYGQPQAIINPQLLAVARRVRPGLQASHAHRRQQGCIAAVAFLGSASVMTGLWGLSVRSLIRAEAWGSQAEVLAAFEAGPDADQRTDTAD